MVELQCQCMRLCQRDALLLRLRRLCGRSRLGRGVLLACGNGLNAHFPDFDTVELGLPVIRERDGHVAIGHAVQLGGGTTRESLQIVTDVLHDVAVRLGVGKAAGGNRVLDSIDTPSHLADVPGTCPTRLAGFDLKDTVDLCGRARFPGLGGFAGTTAPLRGCWPRRPVRALRCRTRGPLSAQTETAPSRHRVHG